MLFHVVEDICHLIRSSVGRREKDASYPPTVYSNTTEQLCSFPSSASHTIISNVVSNEIVHALDKAFLRFYAAQHKEETLMNWREHVFNGKRYKG